MRKNRFSKGLFVYLFEKMLPRNFNLLLFILLCLGGVKAQSEKEFNDQLLISKEALEERQYSKALEIATNLENSINDKNSLKAIQAQNQIGKIHLSADNKHKALSIFFRILKKSSTNDYPEERVNTLVYVGYIYYGMELYDKALKYYESALELAQKSGYDSGVTMSINNIAAVLETKKQYQKAKSFFLQALKVNKTLGNDQWLGINYMNIAVIEMESGLYDSSIYWLEKADSVALEINDLNLEASISMKLASVYQKRGNIEISLVYAMHADSIAKKNEFLDIYLNSNEKLKELYLSQLDTTMAFIHQSIYVKTKEKSNEINNVELALELEQKFLLEKYETEQRLEIERYRRNRNMILISVVLGGLSILMFISRLRTKLKNLRLEKKIISQDLDSRSRQLVTRTVELTKRQQVISSHVKTIEEIIKTPDLEHKNFTLSNLKKIIEKESSEDVTAEFEVYFQKVHNNFYEKLNKRHPNLTKNERRLCAFLYLNMSSKEISGITGQRIATIEVARTRLRKKLNINQTGVSLSSFLIKIGNE